VVRASRYWPSYWWSVSRVALAMFLDGELEALGAYLRGDRSSSTIIEYFARCDVPL
jgi:hypothetical protein